MTMQNLDVYGTFRVQWGIFVNLFPINGLLERRSLKACQRARYFVDVVIKNPLMSVPGSAARRLFFSCVGTPPARPVSRIHL